MKFKKESISYVLNIVGVLFGIAASIATITMAVRVRRDVIAVKTDFAKTKAQLAALTAATKAAAEMNNQSHHLGL